MIYSTNSKNLRESKSKYHKDMEQLPIEEKLKILKKLQKIVSKIKQS